jgi:hypothetical protein
VPKDTDVLTHVILSVFRLNGQFSNAGEVLVSHIGLTGARWQMLGAVALSAGALTVPQIGSAMGVTRQAPRSS